VGWVLGWLVQKVHTGRNPTAGSPNANEWKYKRLQLTFEKSNAFALDQATPEINCNLTNSTPQCRALNSHDVAAPVTPHNQEVSCYIDYNISMSAENLWTVDIVNSHLAGNKWHSINSQVRFIHKTTGEIRMNIKVNRW
jgi:dolichyl-phosphate-mannose--protein O-mannosyl transferase